MIGLNFNSISRADFRRVIEGIGASPSFSDTQRTKFLGYIDQVIKFNPSTNVNPIVSSQNIFLAMQSLTREDQSIKQDDLLSTISSSYQKTFGTYDLGFGDIVNRIHSVINQANQQLISSGASLAQKLAIIDSTDPNTISKCYRGPIAVFIPEMHMGDQPSNLVPGLNDITVRSLKKLNIIALEELVKDSALNIKFGLTEMGMDRSHLGVDLVRATQDDTLEAVNAFAYLANNHGIDLMPAETMEPSIQQELIYAAYSCVKNFIDGQPVPAQYDLFSLFECVDNRPSHNSDNNTSLNIIRTQVNELMDKCAIQRMFEITEDKYMIFKPKFFNSQNSESMLGYKRRLYDQYYSYNIQRDNEIVENFARTKGIIPMIIGSDHLQGRVVSGLKKFGIPIIIIGAEGYKNLIKLSAA